MELSCITRIDIVKIYALQIVSKHIQEQAMTTFQPMLLYTYITFYMKQTSYRLIIQTRTLSQSHDFINPISCDLQIENMLDTSKSAFILL